MSALERVIAELQAEVDRLKRSEKLNTQAWQRTMRQVDDVAQQAFALIDNPTDQDARTRLRLALVQLGYCFVCHQLPCECEGGDE